MSPSVSRVRAHFQYALVIMVIVGLYPGLARADGPVESLKFSSTTFLSGNPLTFGAPIDVRYEHRLYASASEILRRNFLASSVGIVLGPFVAPWVRLELQPLALINVGATYGVNALLVDTTQSFRSPNSDYGVSVFGLPRPTPGYATTMRYLRLDTTVQAGIGKVGLRSTTAATHGAAGLREGDSVYYNQGADLLLPRRGWLFSNDTTIAYEVKSGVRLGVRSTLFATSYPASAYPAGEPHEADAGPVIRLGPSMNVNLRDSRGPFGRIDLFGAAQWYARNRYRTGEVISGYIPYVTAGVRVGGALWER